MGCISSKLMPRSISLKQEVSQRMERSANSITALEELAISQNINDQFLALVYTANTVAGKLRSASFSETKPDPVFDYNNLLSNIKEGEPSPPVLLQPVPHLTKRSRSCHCITGHDLPSPILQDSDISTKEKWNCKGVGRARSFHTVEEYDAMIEKIRLSSVQQSGSESDGSITKLHSIQQSHLNDETSLEDDSKIEKTCTMSSLELENEKQIANVNGSIEKVVDDSPQEVNVLEKGIKRKLIAKGLDSLDIPHTIEFSTATSLREWLHSGGQVCSPGSYVTPKFGSYPLPSSGTEKGCNDDTIFNPELVAAFEECMQQLEAEAETILKQISENWEEECPLLKISRHANE